MRFYIETYGCQMNSFDSGQLAQRFLEGKFERAERAEEAEIILVNTCSVRKHAEDRALGRLRQLEAMKRRGKPLILGVVGCMAQRMNSEIVKLVPAVNLVVGTRGYSRVLEHVRRVLENGGQVVDTDSEDDPQLLSESSQVRGAVKRFVTIMRGCDNFCTFCIVPYVRGEKRSLPHREIAALVNGFARSGVREVTLLGQNVNAYDDGEMDFAALLRYLDADTPVARIRFATSHPKDMSFPIIQAVAECPKVCEQIHLPVQSGSNAVLKRMGRRYSREEYIELVRVIRRVIPGVALSTDIIVGFPGETRRDFEDTLSLMDLVRFDSAFMFKYSPRAGTAAAAFEDDVPAGEKQSRLEQLIKKQRALSEVSADELVGTVQEVLVEERKGSRAGAWIARTRTGRTVQLSTDRVGPGSLVRARLTRLVGLVFEGELEEATIPGR